MSVLFQTLYSSSSKRSSGQAGVMEKDTRINENVEGRNDAIATAVRIKGHSWMISERDSPRSLAM